MKEALLALGEAEGQTVNVHNKDKWTNGQTQEKQLNGFTKDTIINGAAKDKTKITMLHHNQNPNIVNFLPPVRGGRGKDKRNVPEKISEQISEQQIVVLPSLEEPSTESNSVCVLMLIPQLVNKLHDLQNVLLGAVVNQVSGY